MTHRADRKLRASRDSWSVATFRLIDRWNGSRYQHISCRSPRVNISVHRCLISRRSSLMLFDSVFDAQVSLASHEMDWEELGSMYLPLFWFSLAFIFIFKFKLLLCVTNYNYRDLSFCRHVWIIIRLTYVLPFFSVVISFIYCTFIAKLS